MRDYSKPPYDLNELFIVHIGICDATNNPCNKRELKSINSHDITYNINELARIYAVKSYATNNLQTVGLTTQAVIEKLISDGIVTKEKLREYIDKELCRLPPSLFVDYFTGETKIKP